MAGSGQIISHDRPPRRGWGSLEYLHQDGVRGMIVDVLPRDEVGLFQRPGEPCRTPKKLLAPTSTRPIQCRPCPPAGDITVDRGGTDTHPSADDLSSETLGRF